MLAWANSVGLGDLCFDVVSDIDILRFGLKCPATALVRAEEIIAQYRE